ncbi:lipase chaperone [Desulfogranum mediterraneum]|uniref:lipase chaperone n=1 Tax=Desulfogranum mediterraneum TaxID=160661 RepID=UPI000686ABCE|nr:lipase chaperone [Desulfogranum mediterraneum]
MSCAESISFFTAVIAVCALGWQIYQSNKQSKMQTFMTYTQRYQDILINLPVGVESIEFKFPVEKEEKELILRWLRAYFDLCSEEYFLNKNGLIQNEAWNLWEGGMKDSLKKPAFKEAWEELQSNQYYHKEFAGYIKKIIGNNA